MSFETACKMAMASKASAYIECSALTQEHLQDLFREAIRAIVKPLSPKQKKSSFLFWVNLLIGVTNASAYIYNSFLENLVMVFVVNVSGCRNSHLGKHIFQRIACCSVSFNWLRLCKNLKDTVIA